MQRWKARLLAVLLTTVALVANAQQRVFVSVQGDDLNACGATTPCRSFAHAITVVATGGEILALDSGGYGPVSIAKSVSIVAPPGVEASITTSTPGQNAIDINISNGTIVLRGLSLFGMAAGNDGISTLAASNVYVESCNITGFAANGIEVSVHALSTLMVSNSTINQNGVAGITTTGTLTNMSRFDIEHSRLDNNVQYGVRAAFGSRGTIRDSRLSGSGDGFDADISAAGSVTAQIENCTITRNNIGIHALSSTGTANLHVSNCLIANNNNGISYDAGSHMYSRNNNTLVDNTTNGSFIEQYLGQ